MPWQDIILTIANIMFAYALIPQVTQGFKNKKSYINFQTGLLTTVAMYSLVAVYFSLGLFFSVIVSIFNATMWLLLLLQGFIYK